MDGTSVDLSSFENIWAEIYNQYDWIVEADFLDKTNLLKVENFNIIHFFQSLGDYALHELSIGFSQFKSILIFFTHYCAFSKYSIVFFNEIRKGHQYRFEISVDCATLSVIYFLS